MTDEEKHEAIWHLFGPRIPMKVPSHGQRIYLLIAAIIAALGVIAALLSSF